MEGEGETDAGDGVGGYDGGSDSGAGGSGGGANVAGGGRGGDEGRRNYHWQLGEETTMSVERIKSRRAPRRDPRRDPKNQATVNKGMDGKGEGEGGEGGEAADRTGDG